MKKWKLIAGLLLIVSAFLTAIFFAPPEKDGDRILSYQEASAELSELMKNIRWSENFVRRRAKVQLVQQQDLKDTLPDIDQFPIVAGRELSGNEASAEIFVSTEKSGTGIDGLMVEIANAFNARNIMLKNGQRAKVRIRKIASGTAYQFIASRKYMPDAFSPSSQLWIQMASGYVPLKPIREEMFGNIAGIVMKDAVAEKLKSAYGKPDVKNLVDAVVQGNLVMGYTDPFASSTGLNFLVTVLETFARGDQNALLSPEVIAAFENFQRGVPFVALTTIQMRDSVQNDGSLDAFVMEYQTFVNTPVLKAGYQFLPFGFRHDNPLYAPANISPEKEEVLEQFAAFAEQPEYKALAQKYGFNPTLPYKSSFDVPSGDILIRAQKLWKEKKDAGRPISAIFLCDISGSMQGTRIQNLKKALIQGLDFISPENSIGLVFFNDTVSIILPIRKFDLNHKAAFRAAIEDMNPSGGTAMYDGTALSLSLLEAEKKKNPDVKPLLFVLTDGETNTGLTFKDMSPIIKGVKIPVYTIGYEADIKELERLSALVEAAMLNAGEGEIQYKIGSLLNAQM